MLAILIALTGSLAYGFADFAGGLATRGTNVLRVVAVAAPASFLFELIALPVFGASWTAPALAWGAASGLASAAAFGLLYQSLSLGPMGVLSPITALISAVLPAAVGILLGERLSLLGIFGISLALVAVLIISAAGEEHRRPSPLALALAVGAGTAIAAQLICLAQSPPDSGVAPLIIGRGTSSLLLITAFLVFRSRLSPGQAPWRLAVAAGALDAFANLAFLLASRVGDLAVVAVITALYPAGTVLLARVVLSERLTRSQFGGLILAASAVVLLAVS